MRGIFFAGIFAGIIVATTASSAFAATINVTSGPVSVNTGRGYKLVKSVATIHPGDSVMAGAGASATIVYADGCVQTVAAGDTASVSASSPCAAGGVSAAADLDMFVVGVLGAGAVAAGIASATKSGPASP